MAGNDRRDGPDEGVTRRRFVQVCVGVATVAAVGSTVSSFLGVRSPLEVAAPPSAIEAVAMCPVCSVGCGLVSISSAGEAYPPRGDPQSSSTSGMVCTRGTLPPATSWPSTIGTPLKRRSPSTKGTPATIDQFEPVEWEEAIGSISQVMIEVGATNAAARGCILGGDLSLEDAYVAGKLFKGALSSPSIDTVESLHSRATDKVLLDQIGEVASPTCLNDIGLASLIVVVGEDLAVTHPVIHAHVAEAVATKGATLVVIDPRVTQTVGRNRSVHIPVRAGGEVALLNAIGYVLAHELEVAPPQWAIDNSLNARAFAEYTKLYNPVFDQNERVDAAHLVELCNGPSEWVEAMGNRDAGGYLKSFDVPTITGLDAGTIRDLARKWNLARSVLTIWSSRLSGAGDDGAAPSSVVNLHLFTGQIGRPGAGPLGLQAMASGRGAMDGGASPLTLPGSALGGGGPSAALQEAWGLDMAGNAARLPPGKGSIDMLNKARTGELPALLLLGGSVSAQLPDTENLVKPALMSIYIVSTACSLDDPDVMYADMVLPRTSWYEREGHYVSSERKVARSLGSMAPLDGTRTDMEVLAALGSQFVGGSAFDYSSPSVAMDELRRASTGAPADISALPLGKDLTDSRGMQWPVGDVLSASSKGTPRRHMGQDGRGTGFPTETGKALTLPREHPGLRRPSDPDYPLTAVISIEGATWWDGLMFLPRGGDVVRPREVEPAYMEVGSKDALELGLSDGSSALVTSAQGSVELKVMVTTSGAKGHVFIPLGAGSSVQALVPSLPMDGNGIPPWSAFNVRVEPAPLS